MFAKAVKGKGKDEVRVAEEALLQPKPLPKYDGVDVENRSELHSRTALIVFTDRKQQKLISSLLSVRTSVNGHTYITDISLLESLAQAVRDGDMELEEGRIVLSSKHSDPAPEADPDVIHSMREFQSRYFPDDVGVKCHTCGRKLKAKQNMYTNSILPVGNGFSLKELHTVEVCDE